MKILLARNKQGAVTSHLITRPAFKFRDHCSSCLAGPLYDYTASAYIHGKVQCLPDKPSSSITESVSGEAMQMHNGTLQSAHLRACE